MFVVTVWAASHHSLFEPEPPVADSPIGGESGADRERHPNDR
jgi:hypothetical protein